MNHFSVLIRLLRDRKQFLEDVRGGVKLETKIASLLVASSFFFSVYGAIIGSYGGGLQIISSAIKLPALYLITLIICLPTLYFFDILFGSKLNFKQYVTMALTSISVISVLLFSFAPVVLFFLISVKGYDFFLLLNVLIMTITGTVGVRLFYKGMRDMTGNTRNRQLEIALKNASEGFLEDVSETASEGKPKNNEQDFRNQLLKGWVVLYGLVGSQLGWTLRPFFGAEGQPFQIFRPEINGNFYAKVLESIGTMIGF